MAKDDEYLGEEVPFGGAREERLPGRAQPQCHLRASSAQQQQRLQDDEGYDDDDYDEGYYEYAYGWHYDFFGGRYADDYEEFEAS